jgi:hypothetical protein
MHTYVGAVHAVLCLSRYLLWLFHVVQVFGLGACK